MDEIVKVTESTEELTFEELEERLELECSPYDCGNNACCW